LSAVLLAGAPSARAQHFSLDKQSPTVLNGVCDCNSQSFPITEGDILVPGLPPPLRVNPTFPCTSPLPTCAPSDGPATPGVIIYDVDPHVAYSLFLGLADVTGCHDDAGCPNAPPGPCRVEVDALSSGFSGFGNPLRPSTVKFSVDRLSTGVANPATIQYACIPSVYTEAPTLEAHADVFADLLDLQELPPFSPGAMPPLHGNVGVADGEGCRNAITGHQYPGAGPVEPPILAGPGDNVDALEVEEFHVEAGCLVYISLDPDTVDAHAPLWPQFQNLSPADILEVDVTTGTVGRLYKAADLGLDWELDDVDALAIGFPGGGNCEVPENMNPVGVLFSVTRDSDVVGKPDSLYGVRIQPGDILSKPQGSWPNVTPEIYIPAEMLGLVASREPFGVFPDDLDAMAFNWHQQATIMDCNQNAIEDAADIALGNEDDCDANGIPDSCEIGQDSSLDSDNDGILDQCQGTDQDPQDPDAYCFGVLPALCGCSNWGGSGEGCANSTGVGAVLSGYGSRWTANQACLPAAGSGLPATVSRLVLEAIDMPLNEMCMFFQGDEMVLDPNQNPGVPFGDGLRCAGTNVIKIEVVTTDPQGGYASTTVDVAATGQVQVGDLKYYQARYRDPNGPCPSSDNFNLTNGLKIQWDPPD